MGKANMINVKMRKPIVPDVLKKQVESLPVEIKDMITAVVLADYLKQDANANINLFIPDTTIWFVEQMKKYGFSVQYEEA